ncbi:MAG: hypothetical protein WD512_07580, partial [Candidatus Paceibacterota bacterium]
MYKSQILEGNKTGTGILIERDAGFIEPKHEKNIPFVNEMSKLAEGGKIMPEPLTLFVVLQKYGVKNKNGRIYPEHILKKQATVYEEIIQSRSAIGEAEHPESSIINTSRVSHEIKRIWWEGKTLVGEIEILMSPGFVNQGIISCEGDNIANMLRRGIRVGVSSSGVGSVQEVGGNLIVQDDFELICWDIVLNPSTPGSWMFQNKQDATMFMESENKVKPLLMDDLDKF